MQRGSLPRGAEDGGTTEVNVTKNVRRQIDLTDLELVELRLELDKLLAGLTGADGERYPQLRELFELLTEE